jgi:hypothetical protein
MAYLMDFAVSRKVNNNHNTNHNVIGECIHQFVQLIGHEIIGHNRNCFHAVGNYIEIMDFPYLDGS